MSMKEFHHAYFGAAALVLAWVLIFDWAPLRLLPLLHNDIFVCGLVVFGVWMVVDDMYQHWRQKRQLGRWDCYGVLQKPLPANMVYHSPVHRLYVYLFGGLHRRIERWLRK